MAVVITDEGSTILVVDGLEACSLDKATLSIGLEAGENLVLKDSTGKKSVFGHSEVTSPLLGTAELLRDAIEDFKETGGAAPAGNATESTLSALVTEVQGKADLTETQPVSMAAPPTGGATEAKQDTSNTALAAIQAAVEILDNAIAGSEIQTDIISSALPAGASTEATLASLLTELQAKADLIETQPVSAGHNITGINHGIKNVAVAGTDEALVGVSTPAKIVTITARSANTGIIAVGGAGVDATADTGTGIYLNTGDAYELAIDDIADVFIDASVSGEGVQFTYLT